MKILIKKDFWHDIFDFTLEQFLSWLILVFLSICLSTAFTILFIKEINLFFKYIGL